MTSETLLIANAGTPHELTISEEDGRYWLDNTPRGRFAERVWPELPRLYRSVKGAKLGAAYLFGESQVWTEYKEKAPE